MVMTANKDGSLITAPDHSRETRAPVERVLKGKAVLRIAGHERPARAQSIRPIWEAVGTRHEWRF